MVPRYIRRYVIRICDPVPLTDFLETLAKALFKSHRSALDRRGPCQETRWRRAFPEAPKREVHEFLATFARAFDYPSREKLRFRPNDTVYHVYRARYHLAGWAHSAERAALSRLMDKRYHVALEDLWSQTLTLGELFEASRSAPSTRTPPPGPTPAA